MLVDNLGTDGSLCPHNQNGRTFFLSRFPLIKRLVPLFLTSQLSTAVFAQSSAFSTQQAVAPKIVEVPSGLPGASRGRCSFQVEVHGVSGPPRELVERNKRLISR